MHLVKSREESLSAPIYGAFPEPLSLISVSLTTYLFFNHIEIPITTTARTMDMAKYTHLFPLVSVKPENPTVYIAVPGKIKIRVPIEYDANEISVMPYAKFCRLYGKIGTSLVIIRTKNSFFPDSSNSHFFKYLFF